MASPDAIPLEPPPAATWSSFNVNVSSFVTVVPCLNDEENSTNYKIWKEQMLCLVESQGLLGFINGQTLSPIPPDDDKPWRRCDRLVKGWMLGSVGKDALLHVLSLNTARDVWLELEKIFSQDQSTPQAAIIPRQIKPAKEDYSKFLPLYRAAIKGDWQMAKNFFERGIYEAKAIINNRSETALHVAASTGNSNDFVREIVELMSSDALAIQDINGNSALHAAAMVGNMKGVEILVNKDPNLQYIQNKKEHLPIHLAADRGHKDVVKYLISKSKQDGEDSPFAGRSGARLLDWSIGSHLFDIALELVDKHPNLAISTCETIYYKSGKKNKHIDFALMTISRKSFVFPSGESFSWWQKLLYTAIQTEFDKARMLTKAADIENNNLDAAKSKFNRFKIICIEKLKDMLGKVIIHFVPQVKDIARKKLTHQQALEFTRCVCLKLQYVPDNEASFLISQSILNASRNGIPEVMELIIETFPVSIYQNIFLEAVSNRFESIFNLIYQLSDCKHYFTDLTDKNGNNLMHLSARLAPPHKLNLVPGAALQMQRELQWFKETEKIVTPSRRVWLNHDGKTPQIVFTEQHKELKAEGEKWMKDTANACSLAATLIATVVFAAAFTVPGGIESSTGKPILIRRLSFSIFVVADAISLFTSLTALIMFLSILTSRYAEEDFLSALPKRLSIGLITLFISVIFMMTAFSATLYLVLFLHHNQMRLVIPAVALACLPVSCFVLFQFPLLVVMIYSTYGPGIFGKRSNRILY